MDIKHVGLTGFRTFFVMPVLAKPQILFTAFEQILVSERKNYRNLITRGLNIKQ